MAEPEIKAEDLVPRKVVAFEVYTTLKDVIYSEIFCVVALPCTLVFSVYNMWAGGVCAVLFSGYMAFKMAKHMKYFKYIQEKYGFQPDTFVEMFVKKRK